MKIKMLLDGGLSGLDAEIITGKNTFPPKLAMIVTPYNPFPWLSVRNL